jgi:hypothetical protein
MRRRRRARIRWPHALVLAASLLACSSFPATAAQAASSSHHSSTAQHAKKKRKKVKPTQLVLTPALVAAPGIGVTMPPVGLSIEYSIMARALGGEACGPAALSAELAKLGSPPIELGGISQDFTTPSGAVSGPPSSWEAATLYSLPPAFWSQLHCLLNATRDPLTVGLNMRLGNLAWATTMAESARGAATNGLSFSLANEPDLYGLPNYAALATRAAGAEVAEVTQYLQLGAYLLPAVEGAPVIGPELARPAAWRAQLPRLLQQQHLGAVGMHLYPLTRCHGSHSVTIKGLLSESVGSAPARLKWVVADAQAAGVPAILSESNSASCGGVARISDTPAAAVWAVRFVVSALETGFREVRFHLSGEPYDPFLVRGPEVIARPLESALIAVNQWLPVGATVRSVPAAHGLRATAVGEPNGTYVVILDNESGKPRPTVLRGARAARIEEFVPSLAGVSVSTPSSASAVIHLTVPTNAVLAIVPTA